MAKYSILAGISGARVPAVLPPDYHELARMAVRPDGVYTVVLFAHDRRDVVVSGVVRRALRRLDAAAQGSVLAVGANFTEDALAILHERGAIPITLGEFHWTDASYLSVRDL